MRTTYHHGDVHGAALAASLELLDTEGAEALTMTRVADAIGVTRPALNRPFRDVGGLHDAVAATCLADLEAAMRDAARAEADPTRAFRAVGMAYLDWARAFPRRYALIFNVDRSAMPLPDVRRVLLEDAGEPVPGAFAMGSPAGRVSDAAFFSWSAVHGLAMLLSNGPLADVEPARQDAVIATVLQGIGAAFGMAPPLDIAA